MKLIKKAFKSNATAVKGMPMILPSKKLNNRAVVGKRISLLTKDRGLQDRYGYPKKGLRVDKNKAKKIVDQYPYGNYSSNTFTFIDL